MHDNNPFYADSEKLIEISEKLPSYDAYIVSYMTRYSDKGIPLRETFLSGNLTDVWNLVISIVISALVKEQPLIDEGKREIIELFRVIYNSWK